MFAECGPYYIAVSAPTRDQGVRESNLSAYGFIRKANLFLICIKHIWMWGCGSDMSTSP